jgi:multiple sugar transport system permease protein
MKYFTAATRFFNRPAVVAWVLILPTVLCLLVFVLVPLVVALAMSLFDVDIFLKGFTFTGLRNYRELFGDKRFWNALLNTGYFWALAVPLGLTVSLLTAAYVQRNTVFRKLLRAAFYIPVVCSMTAIGIIWAILLDPVIGTLPFLFRSLGLPQGQYLKDPNLAMPLVALLSVWKSFGQNMVIFVAGMQSIPEEYYNAAQVDGAGAARRFFSVTLPMLAPIVGFCLITSTIGSFMVFDQTYVMTNGGPLFRTETIVQYIYMRGFKISPFRLGYASAVSEVLTGIIAVVSILQYRFFTKREEEVN